MIIDIGEVKKLYPKDSRTRERGGGRTPARISFHPSVMDKILELVGIDNETIRVRSPLVSLATELLHCILTGKDQEEISEKLIRIYDGDPLWIASRLESLAITLERIAYEQNQEKE